MFHILDKKGQGVITVREFAEFIKTLGHSNPSEDIEAMAVEIDLHGTCTSSVRAHKRGV